GLFLAAAGWAGAARGGEQVAQAGQPGARRRTAATVPAPHRVGGAARPVPPPVQPAPITTVQPAAQEPAEPVPAAPPPSEAVGFLRDEEFSSESLEHEMTYGIYLPPGYDDSERRYPVLYMLHGAGGHHSE